MEMVAPYGYIIYVLDYIIQLHIRTMPCMPHTESGSAPHCVYVCTCTNMHTPAAVCVLAQKYNVSAIVLELKKILQLPTLGSAIHSMYKHVLYFHHMLE